ncbi:Guanine nucleotide-binding protein negative regulator 1 [Teratosphaeria destructans]|uniref:Guanine nucleotide-binding protein negative regulator 1 n=1 Tax=Teratosphaeria destructans TaxID=418781 RepID=A0A9W7W6T7_9PEZI|nr:Guanine nucleotide-binding protein negative regulator 1 [Teratosphaeria destructans]
MSQQQTVNPRCVGTTGEAFNTTVGKLGQGDCERNFFRSALLSGDGTSVVTHNKDQNLRTFVLPPDLLEDSENPIPLVPYAFHASPTPIQSYALYPGFALQDPSTTLVLSASSEQPLIVRNALDYNHVHARYPWVSSMTEAYYAANSLMFTRDGTHFIAAGKNQIAVFNCEHSHEGPETTFKTGYSRKARKLYGQQSMTCQGIVNAMTIRPEDGVLAAGTTEREVGLYEAEGNGGCITAFSVRDAGTNREKMHGTGITGLEWSPCGTYLVIAERQADVLQVYDIRNTLQRVSILAGRQAQTTQRLGLDVVPTAEGYEVWAGGTDGVVRMWKNAGSEGGEQRPDAELKLHDDAVSSAVWHPSEVVLATCSGSRRLSRAYNDGEVSDDFQSASLHASGADNTLRMWTL